MCRAAASSSRGDPTSCATWHQFTAKRAPMCARGAASRSLEAMLSAGTSSAATRTGPSRSSSVPSARRPSLAPHLFAAIRGASTPMRRDSSPSSSLSWLSFPVRRSADLGVDHPTPSPRPLPPLISRPLACDDILNYVGARAPSLHPRRDAGHSEPPES